MTTKKPQYRFLYIAALLLSLQYAFTLYINSSLLGKFFDEQRISSLYVVGSLVTILGLVLSGRLLKRFGNWNLFLSAVCMEIVALTLLATSQNPFVIQIAFIAHHALPPLLLFGLDIFFEGTLVSPQDTEKVRSYYLTFINISFLVAPLIVGYLADTGSFGKIYALSAVFLGILGLLVFDVFKHVGPHHYRDVSILSAVRLFLIRKNLRAVFLLNFLLQCFYAVMVIFMAPYLHTVIGLGWETIGVIYTIMLLPFVLFEAPLGKLFEKFHDEKQILIAGFLIMSGSLISMTFIHTPNVLAWACALFFSRVGASFVEVASEATFFKHVTGLDANLISIFKLGVPGAYVVAPLIASLIVPGLPMTALFVVLALILVVGAGVSRNVRV